MPTEEQIMTRKIEYVGCEHPHGLSKMVFEVTEPNGDIKVIRLEFRMKFINDYFRIQGMENSIETLRKNKELFKTWGLVKIEENINAASSELEFEITDLEWASKVHTGRLKPSSISKGTNVFYYSPERRIGFHN